MRQEKVTEASIERGDWAIADWKDTEDLLEGIDACLKEHGLQLVLGDYGDDNWWVRVEKGRTKKEAK